MDSRSRLDENPSRAPNYPATDREERLLRMVDDLRTRQVVANAEGGRTGFRRAHGPGVLLAIVLVLMGTAAAFLHISGPSHVHRDAPPDSAVGTAPVQSAPAPAPADQPVAPPNIAQPRPPENMAKVDAHADGSANPAPVNSVPGALSLSIPHPPQSSPAEQRAPDPPDVAAAATPSAAVTPRPKYSDPVAPQHEPNAVASPPPTGAVAEVAEPDTAKPELWVYYPLGSSRAEANARSLAARIASNLSSSGFKAQANLSGEAVIKFSEERHHALARMIGKSLGDSGYGWKIEKTSSSVGSHRNIIEVWLPMKS
jgi:hypothetical protein